MRPKQKYRRIEAAARDEGALRAVPTLGAVGVRPAKARGQNFLVQAAVANRIVDAAHLGEDDSVLEIGPGLGILSERIAAHRVARVTLVELEPRLASRLEERFSGDRRVRVVAGDFLKIDLGALFDRAPIKIISNLPFNSAAAILARLCDHSRAISRMVLMFQREVAERIRAQAGEAAYGALSVFTSLYFESESHFRVAAGNFHPRPKVDAEVLVFQPRADPGFARDDERRVLSTIRAAFSAPRKTLRNALSHALHLNTMTIDESLRRASIDPGLRAETLSAVYFIRLAHELRAALAAADA
ncbi:MAG: 16S rRNA (adenine(1518)-N(6)/adenine(1519)-N(6))-dimethyltransferase RsmA [Candidatus Binataceae bacterium]